MVPAMAWIGAFACATIGIAKIGLVVILAAYFLARQRDIKTFMGLFIPSMIIGCCCGLIILQPDFGTCFLCGAVAATMMFQSGLVCFGFYQLQGVIVAFSILVYFDPVRIRRVTSFLDVEANAVTVPTNCGRVCSLSVWRKRCWIGNG